MYVYVFTLLVVKRVLSGYSEVENPNREERGQTNL